MLRMWPQAFKNRDEKYKLIWPEKSEFVRMAARFGATIIPFAAVGAEDGVNQASESCVILRSSCFLNMVCDSMGDA